MKQIRAFAAEPSPTPNAAARWARCAGPAFCLLFLVLGSRFAAADEPVLRGIASTGQPASGGIIALYDGRKAVQSEPYHRFYNGTFAVPLNEAAESALAAGVLRVVIAVDRTTTLVADPGVFDPAAEVLFVNPLTTIAAAYRNLEPATSATRALGTVALALGVGSPAATACESTAGVDTTQLVSAGASPGSFNAYVESIAREVVQGDAPSVANAYGVPVDFRDFFLETAAEIFGEAVGGFPGAKPLAGWILGQVFEAPGESQQEIDKIIPELDAISGKLDEVLAGISQIQGQITELEKNITDQIKRQNYQNDAAMVQTYINSLCNMQKQLIYLAAADPNQNNTQYAANLAAEIQRDAGLDLLDMWSNLEGNGTVGTRSLLNEWSDAVGVGPHYPTFANVSYLRSAVPNLQYYLGAMLVGYDLLIEGAHWQELNGAGDLAKRIITGSSKDFEEHDDIEMKLVAHNIEIGGPGTTGLYAAVLPSFFAAIEPTHPKPSAADPTDPENWAIDTRSGLLWFKGGACLQDKCDFAMYDQTGGWGSGVLLAKPYMADINRELFAVYPELPLNLAPPSEAQWLLESRADWLGGYDTGWWTSDVQREAPGPQLFPDWDNWRFLATPTPVQDMFAPSYGVEHLDLISAAPLTDPNHFLYRSHQDDFSMNVFTGGPTMTTGRAGATATPLLNGKVLIAGGVGADNRVLSSTELYDPATDSFAAGPSMNAARSEATATLLPTGKVLIAGGRADDNGAVLKSTELYDPASNTFAAAAATASMNYSHEAATATLVPNGRVLITGWPRRQAELYDPDANTFVPADLMPAMDTVRYAATATLLPNGKVLIAGEYYTTDLYDPAANTFAAGPAMDTGRFYPTATLLPNGKVLIAGGASSTVTEGLQPLNSTELYDPAANTFAAGPAMETARYAATATLLPNGRVLIVGGKGDGGEALDSVELYDPISNTFTAGPPMDARRDSAIAVVLPDSQVLIAGGDGAAPLASTDLYTE